MEQTQLFHPSTIKASNGPNRVTERLGCLTVQLDPQMTLGQHMDLEDPQEGKIREWLEALGYRLSCPLCGSESLRSKGILAPARRDAEGDPKISHAPMLQLVCTSCAYVMLFDAEELGLA